eukprot:5598375-Pyramimonas_sp.AAC.1
MQRVGLPPARDVREDPQVPEMRSPLCESKALSIPSLHAHVRSLHVTVTGLARRRVSGPTCAACRCTFSSRSLLLRHATSWRPS